MSKVISVAVYARLSIADDLKNREVLCPEYLRIKNKCRHGKYG